MVWNSFATNYTPSRRRQWHPTPVLLPGKSHGQRSLVGCSPWGRKESDMTEWLHFHFSLSCIGEGNGNPLQRSCLENPRDGGAWWAATYGVAQSRTLLKWLSSSSSVSQMHDSINSANTVLCRGVWMPYRSPMLHLFIPQNLTWNPWQLLNVLLFLKICIFQTVTLMDSYSMSAFCTGSFY